MPNKLDRHPEGLPKGRTEGSRAKSNHGKPSRQHTGPRTVRAWWHIDATSVPLGRVATDAARMLIGRKAENKAYYHHTGYPGGLRTVTAGELISNDKQTDMIKHAVKGMLPKNQLAELMIKRLYVYLDAEHPHTQAELKELSRVEK